MSYTTMHAHTLHRLRVFATIVRHGSMTEAAHVLGISRSVVSGHLKHLESDLGVRLLERTTRRMHLTQVGRLVYDASERMVDAAQEALDAVGEHLGTVGGVLRVAFPVDLGDILLVPVIDDLRRAYPDLRIELLGQDRPVDLVRERVDVAIRAGIPHEDTLVMRKLSSTAEVFLASPKLAAAIPLTADGLPDLHQVPTLQHALIPLDRFPMRHPDGRHVPMQTTHPVVTAGDTHTLRQLAARGAGIALIPELLVRNDLLSGRLVRVAYPWTRRRIVIYALMTSRAEHPNRQAFFSALQRRLSDLSVPLESMS